MRYLPHTPEEIASMCRAIGVAGLSSLFEVIPPSCRLQQPFELEEPRCELDLLAHLEELSRQNQTVETVSSFLGGGAYHHYIPAAVGALTGRGEFQTSYTPYQPELSQGTLQAIFEFQTMIASLTGMEVANASHYDGASALAEAVLMALRITQRRRVLVAASVHPDYRRVLRTYLFHRDCLLEEIACDDSGRIDRADFQARLAGDVAACCVQSPNAFGVVEQTKELAAQAHGAGALYIAGFSEALSLGLLRPPGVSGADIVAGEGSSFGNALQAGGPALGLFATRQSLVRQMPGRLVGETVDAAGRRGFVLVLSTREQHIRREKATSNVCTNQALCALTATVYLSLLGPRGLRHLAELNYGRARYLRQKLCQIRGVRPRFTGPVFNEFVLQLPVPAEAVLTQLRQKNIWGGISLQSWGHDDELKNCLLVCATEMNLKNQLDAYAEAMKAALGDL